MLKDGYTGKVTEKEVLDWCKENMAAYKRPRFIEFTEDLPKTARKVLRRLLVEREKRTRAGA